MVAWILRGVSLRDMAPVGALTTAELVELEHFKEEFVARLTRAASPETR
jgi:hypothetical protein